MEPGAAQVPVEELPELCYPYLRASRYCESDLLAPMAWSLFGATPPGWERVQAICDWVHRRLIFDESAASSTKTATEALREGRGVCRDFAHLAVAFCRALNIPARYCTGYMGYTGVEPSPEPIDYSGWFEAYLGGAGSPSTHAPTSPASAGCWWGEAAMPPMCRSCTPSAAMTSPASV